jgi:hypothetical protein
MIKLIDRFFYAVGGMVSKTLSRHGNFAAALLVAGVKPVIRSKRLDLGRKFGMLDTDIPDHQWEVKVDFDKDGNPTKVVRDDGKDVTAEVGKLPVFKEYAGEQKTMILEGRVTHVDAAKKALAAGAKSLLPNARPWKFKDKEFGAELRDPKWVLQSKENGVLVEMHFDKDGKLSKAVSARGGDADLRNGIPQIRDGAHPALRDSIVVAEVTHPKGLHFTSGLLHAAKENAEAVVRKDGQPRVAVLFVKKVEGSDKGSLKYPQMRELCETVASKLQGGYVPEECAGTEQDKRSFVDRIIRANRTMEIPKQDGVVAYPKDEAMSGATLLRQKPPQSFKVVLMGFEKSAKLPGAAGAFEYGDGQRVMGKVNIADPNMRVAVYQNPDRYKNRVAVVEGSHRSSKTGAVFTPVLRQILWEEKPDSVHWDPKAAEHQRMAGMGLAEQVKQAFKVSA